MLKDRTIPAAAAAGSLIECDKQDKNSLGEAFSRLWYHHYHV